MKLTQVAIKCWDGQVILLPLATFPFIEPDPMAISVVDFAVGRPRLQAAHQAHIRQIFPERGTAVGAHGWSAAEPRDLVTRHCAVIK